MNPRLGVIVAFSGHRPEKLGGYGDTPLQRAIVAALRKRLVELRPALAISGMALGVDTWAAQLCIELGIPFDAYVPFNGQESKWPKTSQAEYLTLLRKARRVRVIADRYSTAAFQRRNEAMVDDCDALIAVWDGSSGGTANCYNYAARVKQIREKLRPLTIDRIDPRTLIRCP